MHVDAQIKNDWTKKKDMRDTKNNLIYISGNVFLFFVIGFSQLFFYFLC